MSMSSDERKNLGMAPGGQRSTRLQRWLKIDPLNRPKVYAQVYAGTDLSSLSYWLGIVFSAGIATFGLIQNSPAVIIGAMLISPLMGPIMATGLGLAVGDLYLALKAITNLVLSVVVAVGLSAFIVRILPFHSPTAEILARTNPTLLDLGIALFCGLAGSVVVGRAGSDGLTALPGVAIAVALMPPLCSIGFGAGSGLDNRIMRGAGLLFLTNLVAIVSSAFVVFLLIGMNSKELAAQMKVSRTGEALARRLATGRAGVALTQSGRPVWRVGALLALLCAVAVPLKSAFVQLTEEAADRSTVQRVVKDLLPPGALMSQQVSVGRQDITVHLFSTKEVPSEQRRQAEETIEKRSGRVTQLSISTVASQSQVAEMLDRLSAMSTPPAPPPAAPAEPSLADVQAELVKRVSPVLKSVWPAEAPLSSYDLAVGPDGVALQATYRSSRDLTPIALALITNQLRDQLKAPSLTLEAKRRPVTRSSTRYGHPKR